jgi:hypothetical protein
MADCKRVENRIKENGIVYYVKTAVPHLIVIGFLITRKNNS